MSDPPVFASEAWARSHGCRGIASCNSTPLAAFEAGAAAERDRIRQLALDCAATADEQALTDNALIPGATLRKFADLLGGDG